MLLFYYNFYTFTSSTNNRQLHTDTDLSIARYCSDFTVHKHLSKVPRLSFKVYVAFSLRLGQKENVLTNTLWALIWWETPGAIISHPSASLGGPSLPSGWTQSHTLNLPSLIPLFLVLIKLTDRGDKLISDNAKWSKRRMRYCEEKKGERTASIVIALYRL
ncbi:hypothetical protein BgiBS90_024670 [Biomphalaria glabrata]|nr:hypothetical protein BgiBS90_024670 [Biomphalaria glabrata]